MSLLPTGGLGKRVAFYRKLNGWSAEKLAQESGDGVTRAILAQLESGRRDGLSLQQFMAIAVALGVPPAALLADAMNPDEQVELPPSLGGDGERTVAVGEILQWVSGNGELQSDLPSAQKWQRVSKLLWRRYISSDELVTSWFGTDTPLLQSSDDWVQLAWRIGRLRREAEDALRAEGVNLSEAPASTHPADLDDPGKP